MQILRCFCLFQPSISANFRALTHKIIDLWPESLQFLADGITIIPTFASEKTFDKSIFHEYIIVDSEYQTARSTRFYAEAGVVYVVYE